MKVLDLGCGWDKYVLEGAKVIGIDNRALPSVDIIHDLEEPLPFKDDEFDLVVASHVFEHIRNLIPLMSEVHRILKPDGMLKAWMPYCASKDGFGWVTHIRGFSLSTMREFTYQGTPDIDIHRKWSIRREKLHFFRDADTGRWRAFRGMTACLLNMWTNFTEKFFPHVIAEIYVEMVPIK